MKEHPLRDFSCTVSTRIPRQFLLIAVFFTLISSVYACPISPPGSVTFISPQTCSSATLSWSAVSGATAYEIDYSLSPIFATGVTTVAHNMASPTQKTISGLVPDVPYYFRVRSKKTGCISINSATATLNTAAYGTPILYFPPGLITCNSFRITWGAINYSNSYTLEVKKGATTILTQTVSSGTLFYNVNSLDPGTTYTCEVTSNNSVSGCTLTGSANVTTPLPTPVTSGSSATDITCTTFKANWAVSTSATGYYLDVATTAVFGPGDFVSGYNNLYVSGGSVNFKSVTGLNPSTNYFYRVRATNGTCTTSNSSVKSLTTLSLLSNPLLYVQPNSITCNSALITWGALFGADNYTLEVTDAVTNAVMYSGTIAGITQTVSGLSPNTTYNYTLTANKSTDCGSSSSSSFSTRPILSAPVTLNSTLVSCGSYTFSWSSVSGATGYKLQVSTDPGFSSFFFDDLVTGTSRTLSGLTIGTTYYYRVASTNGGISCLGTFSFAHILVPANTNPAPPVLINSSGTCKSLDLTWTNSYSRYHLQICQDPYFGLNLVDVYVNGSTFNTGDILEPGNLYFIRLASVDLPSCEGNFSDPAIAQTIQPTAFFASEEHYETCTPVDDIITVSGTCVGFWQIEIQNYTDNTYSTRTYDPNAEWIGPYQYDPLPFPISGLTNYVLSNGGSVYPSNMVFAPNGYYKIILRPGYSPYGIITPLPEDHFTVHVCHFGLNDDITEGPIHVCAGAPIMAHSSIMAGTYDILVEEVDGAGNPTGPSSNQPITSVMDLYNGFDIVPFFSPFSFTSGNRYRVTLTSGSPSHSSSKIIVIDPAVSNFTINTLNTATVKICNSVSVNLDGTSSLCHLNDLELNIADCDEYGTLTSGWTNGTPSSLTIDIKAYATSIGKTLVAGQYYKLKFGVGNPKVYSEKIIYIYPALTADAGVDQVRCVTSITLNGNTPSYGTGTWSIISGGTGTFSNVNAYNSTFTPAPGSIGVLTLRWTISSVCGPVFDEMDIHLNPISHNNANEAYIEEACYHRPICIDGYGYVWDASAKQYRRYTNTDTYVLFPIRVTRFERTIASMSASPGYYSFDNVSSGVGAPWDEAPLFVIAMGVEGTQYSMLDLSASGSSYSIYNPFYSASPGAGSYNFTTSTGVIDPGNVDNGASNDYLFQQNMNYSNHTLFNHSKCNSQGDLWRSPTKHEMGVTEDFANAQNITIDPAYVDMSITGPLLSSSVSGVTNPFIWAFDYIGRDVNNVKRFNSVWHDPHDIVGTTGLCVFKANPLCELGKKASTGIRATVSVKKVEVSVKPNPTRDVVTFNTPSEGVFTYQLVDVHGKVVGNGTVKNDEIISLREFASGLYIIRLSDENGEYIESLKVIRID